MREIKFRVWDKYYNTLRYGGDGKAGDIVISIYNNSSTDNFKVMQFTSLKDKAGREIYEGDIVKYTYQTYTNEVESGIGEVFFEEGIFYFDREMYFAANDTNFGLDSLEIIGNIFENPELLEKSIKTSR